MYSVERTLCRNSAIGTKRSDHNKEVAALTNIYRQVLLIVISYSVSCIKSSTILLGNISDTRTEMKEDVGISVIHVLK